MVQNVIKIEKVHFSEARNTRALSCLCECQCRLAQLKIYNSTVIAQFIHKANQSAHGAQKHSEENYLKTFKAKSKCCLPAGSGGVRGTGSLSRGARRPGEPHRSPPPAEGVISGGACSPGCWSDPEGRTCLTAPQRWARVQTAQPGSHHGRTRPSWKLRLGVFVEGVIFSRGGEVGSPGGGGAGPGEGSGLPDPHTAFGMIPLPPQHRPTRSS